MLERLFHYISSHSGVNWVTFDEIADDFRRRFPRESTVQERRLAY